MNCLLLIPPFHQRGKATRTRSRTMPTYSLWLEPEPTSSPALPKLAAVIASGPGPVFTPHVTLAGGLDLPDDAAAARAARAIAAHLPTAGVRVRLTRVATGTTYHQSVYALVEKTPELAAAAAAARAAAASAASTSAMVGEADEAAAAAAYMPHVSLLYSEDENDRSAFAAACARDLDLDAVSFDGVRVTAWTSGGPVEAWSLVEAVASGDGAS